jgi:hypothetical protein
MYRMDLLEVYRMGNVPVSGTTDVVVYIDFLRRGCLEILNLQLWPTSAGEATAVAH